MSILVMLFRELVKPEEVTPWRELGFMEVLGARDPTPVLWDDAESNQSYERGDGYLVTCAGCGGRGKVDEHLASTTLV
jgi:hypothetical protein